MGNEFHRLDPENHQSRPPEVLARRGRHPDGDPDGRAHDLVDHRRAAPYFQPSAELVDAVNIALAVEAPLLLTGEPGTGKTQVAFYVAHYFGIPDGLFHLYVRSTTRAEELLYRFDEVAYFHASHDPARQGTDIEPSEFIKPGPLWLAYSRTQPSVVLIDEIDKAPRDFPNDLLNVLDQNWFEVQPTGETVHPQGAPPLVVITSNSERRLPEPFLRRIIFHNIRFDDELLRRAVEVRGARLALDPEVREAAIERFLDLRGQNLRKKPATSELLLWLALLSARPDLTAQKLRDLPLAELPALAALVKDRDDLAQL